MGGWWVHDLVQDGRIPELLSWVFWVIASIVLHELAHGWAAIWQGDDTPIRLHRMTANPMVHMGPFSLLMFALIGFAWGVMPVDPSRFRWRRKGRIVVSGAGPAMNVLLAFVSLTLLIIWLKVGPQGETIYRNLAVFFWTGGWINVVLAALNLLPIPPLDGAGILSGMSLRIYQLYQHPRAQLIGMVAVLFIFFSGIASFILAFASLPAVAYAELGARLLGAPSPMDIVF